jgi:methyl-accepting chemotaxis protein
VFERIADRVPPRSRRLRIVRLNIRMKTDEAFLEKAFHAHTEWKVKLRTAIANKEPLDAESIERDDKCALGEWLHGEGKSKYEKLPAYSECVASHAAFHKAAGRVARTIRAQKFDEASKMLDAGTPFSMASTEVGLALSALKKHTQR